MRDRGGVGLAMERTFQGPIICRGYRRTWAFPVEVATLLEEATAGLSVLHLFGGQATWGLRLDADRATRPAVVGNAFFPPFRCESFDVVICDPPYRPSNGMYGTVATPAACLARRWVWWFSTGGLDHHCHGLRLHRWWVVMPSGYAQARVLAELERTRHPHLGCHPVQFPNPQVRKYDWRSRLAQDDLPFRTVGQ